MTKDKAIQLLKQANLRATQNRINILQFLDKQKYPIGVGAVLEHFSTMDKVTVYRIFSVFEEKGIVKKYDIGHDHLDYELANRKHHHYVICKGCGDIEDLSACTIPSESELLQRLSKFSSINEHKLTIEGICKSCK